MSQVPLYMPTPGCGAFYFELTVEAPEDMVVDMQQDGSEWLITIKSNIHLEIGQIDVWEVEVYRDKERLIWYRKVGTFDDWELRTPFVSGKYYVKVERIPI